jgi:hypothetical protein
MQESFDPEDSDLFDGFGNGSLHIYAVCEPDWIPYQDGEARYLNLDFHYADWEALLWNALGAGQTIYDQYVEGDNIVELEERNREKFHRTTPEYPLLARIFDMHEDYFYTPKEVSALREECLLLKTKVNEQGAVKALRKLIYACVEVLKIGCNLMFVCD